MLTDQQNFDSRFISATSLHLKCHRQITHGKFNLKTFYPASYKRNLCNYQAIEGFGLDKAFLDRIADDKTYILTKTMLNIMSNFIPNGIVTIDDRDSP